MARNKDNGKNDMKRDRHRTHFHLFKSSVEISRMSTRPSTHPIAARVAVASNCPFAAPKGIKQIDEPSEEDPRCFNHESSMNSLTLLGAEAATLRSYIPVEETTWYVGPSPAPLV